MAKDRLYRSMARAVAMIAGLFGAYVPPPEEPTRVTWRTPGREGGDDAPDEMVPARGVPAGAGPAGSERKARGAAVGLDRGGSGWVQAEVADELARRREARRERERNIRL